MAVFWLIVVSGILALLQTLYYSRRALSNVAYSRRFGRPKVFAGDGVELIEVLENNKLIPVPWVRVESRISPYLSFKARDNLDISLNRFHKSLFFLGGYSRITRTHEIACLHRGYFDCGLVSVTAGDLFALSSRTRDLMTDARLMVYPRLASPSELPENALKWQGEIAVRRWIDPDPILVTGITDYRPGTGLRDIHWNATARTGALQAKVRDYTVSPRVLLVFNSQISDTLWNRMEPHETEFLENGISYCAALAAWCVGNGLDVGFATNGGSVPDGGGRLFLAPSSSYAQLDGILEALAVLKIEMKLSFTTLLDELIGRGLENTDILIVTAYRSASMEERAFELRRQGNSVTYIPIGGEAET